MEDDPEAPRGWDAMVYREPVGRGDVTVEMADITGSMKLGECLEVSTFEGGEDILRKLGFIQQTGTVKTGLWKKEVVYYDHRLTDTPWCSYITSDPVSLKGKPCTGEFLFDRSDKGPCGVIRIIGRVDFKRMLHKDATSKKRGKLIGDQVDMDGRLHTFLKHRHNREKKEKEDGKATKPLLEDSSSEEEHELKTNARFEKLAQEEKVTSLQDEKRKKQRQLDKHGLADIAGADEEDNLQNIIDAGDEDGSLLTIGDLAKFIKQYITRSIVTAAKTKGAVIINTDTGDIKSALAKGTQAAGEVRDLNDPDHYIPIATGRVPVINIQRFEEGSVETFMRTNGREVTKWFSHHILLHKQQRMIATDGGVPTMEATDGCECTAKDISTTVLRILEAASEGGRGTAHPKREGARVVGILIGGDLKSAKFDILPFVQNKWPLLIIEGSGGYADELASLIRKIEERSGGTASKDDYQSYLSNVDSSTAQIIYEGEWKLVRKGLVPETFTRLIQQAISGDEILNRAWESYAAWSQLARANERRYRNMMMWILVLGSLATAISILQTFLQLTWQDETDGKNKSGSRKWAGGDTSVVSQLYAALSIVVVVLPIAVSLMQSITNKINAGAKWVSLKSAAEGLLSEIYMYRTRSGMYSDQEIKKASEKRLAAKRSKERKEMNLSEKDEANGDVPQYGTRSELLHIKLTAFTQELVQSEMSENSIPKYKGSVPPVEITKYGDDGYSELTIAEYVKMRLAPKVAAYNKDAARYDKYKTGITLTIYALGALGTALAALATFEQLRAYNIGAWVALTTSLGNALTRYLDYTKTEWLHNKYTAVMHELESLEAWWSARGSDGAKAATMDEMVAGCEDKITEEISEFKQQLKIAVAEAAKEAEKQADDRAAIKDSLLRGEQPELVKKMETLGVNGFNADAITNALKDPTGPEAAQLKRLMQRVDDEFGGAVEKIKAEAEKTKIGKTVISRVQDLEKYKEMLDPAINIVEGLKNGANPFNVEKYLPQDLLDTIKDVGKRKQFLSMLEVKGTGKDPWQMSYQDLLGIAKGCGRQFKKQMNDIPYRIAMEGIGKMCFTELFTQFEEALDKLGLNALDFVESRDQVDVFISEMRKLGSLPQNCEIENIIAACSCKTMRNTLTSLSESKVRSILKRSSKFFIESSPTLELMKSVQDTTCDMDLDLVLGDDDDLRCMVLAKVNQVTGEFPEHFLDKDELLAVFPDEVGAAFKDKSHSQVTALIGRLKKGTLGKRMLDQWMDTPDELHKIPSLGALESATRTARTAKNTMMNKLSNFPSLEVMLHAFNNRQKFSCVSKQFLQHEVNNMSKSAILKRIQNTIGSDSKLIQDLKLCDAEGIRMVMSGIKAAYSNSYAGRVFDSVADDIVSFDVDMIFDYEDKEKLMARVKDFKGVNIHKKSKDWIAGVLGYKSLVTKCAALDQPQLQELILRLQAHTAATFNKRVFDKAVENLNEESNDSFKEAGLCDWGDQMVDRFVSHCITLQDEVLAIDYESEAAFKQAATNDEQLLRLTSSLSGQELRLLIEQIRMLAGEKVIANIFEAASKDIPTEEMYHIFDSTFMLPKVRQRFVICMTNLLMNDHRKVLHMSDITDETADIVLSRLKKRVVLPVKTSDKTGKVCDPGVDVCDELRATVEEVCDEHHNTKLVDALRRIFKGKNRLNQVVHFLLAEFKISIGYRLFLKLASDLSSFSLKEIVKGSRPRHCLFPLLLRILWSGRLGFKPPQDGETEGTELAVISITVQNKTMIVTPTKDHIIKLLEEFDDGPLATVTSCLTGLTLQQFKLLISGFYMLIRTTYAGAFFQMLERSMMLYACGRGSIGTMSTEGKRKKYLETDQAKRERNEAIASIKNYIRLEPERVATSFDGFDARLFASRLSSEKKKLLSKYIASDSVVIAISGYYEHQVKSFFSYLKTSPQFQILEEIEEEDEDLEEV